MFLNRRRQEYCDQKGRDESKIKIIKSKKFTKNVGN